MYNSVYFFSELALTLAIYDLLEPLDDALDSYVKSQPDDWASRTALAIISFYQGNLDKSAAEFDAAFGLASADETTSVFLSAYNLAQMNPEFKEIFTEPAASWKDKMLKSQDKELILSQLKELLGQ